MTEQRSSAGSIDPAKLDRLAEVAVKVGLGLRPGQDLLLTAPAIALPLVRRIAVHAYKAGAGIVTPILSDEEMTLARYRHGQDNSFDRAANWLYEGMAKAFSDNTARLAIVGDNPMLLSGEDPSKVARASKANSIAYQPALEKIVNFDTNWNIIAYPSPSWAKQVFLNDPEDVAVGKLADAIFAAPRVDREDAMANWASHNAELRERTNWLNGKRFRALQYPVPAPTSRSALPTAMNGKAALPRRRTASAATPTSRPRKSSLRRIAGASRAMSSSKPLSYQGTLIDNIAVRFEDGKIVDAKASRGAEVLEQGA